MVTLNFDAQRCGKIAAALMLGSTLAACSNMPDLASRNAPFETAAPASVLTPATVAQDQPATAAAAQLPMTVTAINVTVPRALSVSTAISFGVAIRLATATRRLHRSSTRPFTPVLPICPARQA